MLTVIAVVLESVVGAVATALWLRTASGVERAQGRGGATPVGRDAEREAETVAP